jgi:Family of unknown function (DUF6188)
MPWEPSGHDLRRDSTLDRRWAPACPRRQRVQRFAPMPDQEAPAPSDIPIGGRLVDIIEFYGGLVYLGAGARPDGIRLQISGEFSLTDPDGDEMVLNTERPWPTMAVLLSLQYAPIEAITIDQRAVLRLRIGGWSLAVGPDPESWALNGPGSEFRAAY